MIKDKKLQNGEHFLLDTERRIGVYKENGWYFGGVIDSNGWQTSNGNWYPKKRDATAHCERLLKTNRKARKE